MKTVLVLGAGIYQLPLIQTIRAMGYRSIVVSIAGNYPGFVFADKVFYIDTTDAKEVLAIARQEKIDGICTSGTDVAIGTLGVVCDALKLPGISFASAKIVNNKSIMKDAFQNFHVRTARYINVSTVEESYNAYKNMTKPLIFKAIDSSGSRGIVKITNESQINYAYEVVKSITRHDFFIIEEFLEGEEFGAQAFVIKGDLQFFLPHGDYVFSGDSGVPIGHFVPLNLTSEVFFDCREQLVRAVQAAGLNTCAVNADFILSNGKVYVLEIGARAGATCLAELTSIFYGFNYYEQIVRASLGLPTNFAQRTNRANASMLLMAPKSGKIVRIENLNQPDPRLVEVQLDYRVGDQVRQFRVGPDRIGHVITQGDTLDEAVAVLKQALYNISIEIE